MLELSTTHPPTATTPHHHPKEQPDTMTILVWFIAASIIFCAGFVFGAGMAAATNTRKQFDHQAGLEARCRAAERDRDAETARADFLSAENELMRATINRHNTEQRDN